MYAGKMMITADCGGSNSHKTKLWKYELQRLATELNINVTVYHFLPGISKWNKIEHRMFCHISQNWRGRALVDLETIVELIGNTRTTGGLTILTKVDHGHYETGCEVDKEDFEAIRLVPMEFHGEWNYTIHPQANIA